jgi:class 3 adenylate cyclase
MIDAARKVEPDNSVLWAMRFSLLGTVDVSAPGGERKTVTALFADIRGSTELMEDPDPEEAPAVVDPVLRIMVEAVHRYEGYVVQTIGDGICPSEATEEAAA